MTTFRSLTALALMALPALALAAPDASVDVVYIPSADTRVSSPVYLSDGDGTGFGIRGALRLAPRFFSEAEFQVNTYQSVDADILGSVARLGFGTPLVTRETFELYGLGEALVVDFTDRVTDVPVIEEGGVGMHLGVRADLADWLAAHARAGVLKLEDSDGREFLAGLSARFDNDVGGVVEFRRSEVDSIQGLGTSERVNYQFSEVRVAIRFYFGERGRP